MKAKRTLALLMAVCMLVTAFTALPTVSAATVDELAADKILEFDFSDYNGEDSYTDAVSGLTVDVSAFEKGEGKDGASALKANNNGTIRWYSEDFDPFAQCEEGATLFFHLRFSSHDGYVHIFNWKKYADCGFLIATEGSAMSKEKICLRDSEQYWNDGVTRDTAFPGLNTWIDFAITQDATGKMVIYLDGKQINSHDYKTTLYAISQYNSDNAQYNVLGPISSDYDQWSGNPSFSGDLQSFAIYDRALTADEILALYAAGTSVNQEKIDAVKALVESAKTAENGSAAQAAAVRAAVNGYNELNSLEKDSVTNYGDLDAVKDAYYAATGLIMGFDFNGNYDEVLCRTTINDYKGHASLTDTELVLDGQRTSMWQKKGAIYRLGYPVLGKGTDGITIEMRVKAESYTSDTSIFAYTHGTDRQFRLIAKTDGRLRLNMKCQNVTDSELEAYAPAGTAPLNTWYTVSIVQSKDGDVYTTQVLVDGEAVITTTDFPSIALMDRTGTEDDVYFFGSSDYADCVFDGSIDYAYVYNYAKLAEALDLSVTNSDAAVVASDVADKYNITWNANVAWGEETNLAEINDKATFTEYGVIYGTSEEAVEAAAAGEATENAKVKAFASGEDIDVYTIFGFRLKNVAKDANRVAMFYVTYEVDGTTFTAYSPAVLAQAAIA